MTVSTLIALSTTGTSSVIARIIDNSSYYNAVHDEKQVVGSNNEQYSYQFVLSGLSIGSTYSFSVQFKVIGYLNPEAVIYISSTTGGTTLLSAQSLPSLTIVSTDPDAGGSHP